MRMWRNWQTRRFQVPVGNRVGSNPFIRTTFLGQNRWILLFFLCEKPETARLFVIKLIVLGQNLGKFWGKS